MPVGDIVLTSAILGVGGLMQVGIVALITREKAWVYAPTVFVALFVGFVAGRRVAAIKIQDRFNPGSRRAHWRPR